MIGILLVASWSIFAEISRSIGKYEMEAKKESLYALGFLHAIWATIFLLISALFIRHEFVFSLASLPTFLARAVLETILIFISINAILRADRSTAAFLGVLTIPLILLADFSLGYAISLTQIWGIAIIVVAIILLSYNKGLSADGKILAVLSAILSAATISLYKYNITNFNSVEAEGVFTHLIIIVVLLITAKIRIEENLLRYLKQPIFFLQSFAAGLAVVFISFAYLFAPASIITTAKRALDIIASIISGKAYFHEKHLAIKIACLVLIVVGTILMIRI